ncbi:hypothetical protein [Sphingobium sp. HDIP04]|uniref:hypothetical protein n=1 Tax=Sphingobium sp. HDIP04 TaxID=428994 RepID=UPI000387842F|nr:hypothetical protein [Sphingobium sp. HDIP04]EQB03908.1 hypothetical protein L286_11125 [Sphingobium sp. HDIP04]
MTEDEQQEAFAGTEPKSSAAVLSALKKAEKEFLDWNATCSTIDDIYNRSGNTGGLLHILEHHGWQDSALDLFWSSYEIMKPAVYARPPVPAVSPLFKDNRPLNNTVADVLERSATSTFALIDIDDVMIEVRDDLIFTSRGVIWCSYESDGKGGGQRACVEHLDRTDFLHEPARKWAEVGWVARRAWMTRADMRKRFKRTSGDAYKDAKFTTKRDDEYGEDQQSQTKKAGVWEVWHKADNKVYWATDGVEVLLDSGEPHLKLSGFFPCPRPAYGTLNRRSLVPSPDWIRYAIHFRKISDLTRRIYLLLDEVRMKGLIPAGGDIGDAVETLMRSDDDRLLIPVPGAAMIAGGSAGFVAWLPLNEIAQAIQGLIEARAQLIEDFYQLSGISDIMRGATEEQETLGAQRLKSQYGSVRVRGKIDELQRIAADTVKIIAEIIADNFSQKTIVELAQMEIPTKSDIEKRIGEVEKAAKKELEALSAKAKEAAQQAQGEQAGPQQAKQAFDQAQQQIIQKYAPMLAEAEQQVPIEDVMNLLRDDRARSFTFEIETDSTILTDEMAEKASRNEFMQQFTATSTALMQIAAMGEEGAALAGEFMKFALAPYRVGRQLEGVIEQWVKAAPQYAAQMQGNGQQDESAQALAQANLQIAQAEAQKAQAAVAKVQVDAQRAQMDFQQSQQEATVKAQQDQQRFMLEVEQTRGSVAETGARIEKIWAEIQKMGIDANNQVRAQDREDVKATADIEARRTDQAMNAMGQQQDAAFRERDMARADRGEDRADRQQDFSEQSSDRQMTLAEREAGRE